MTMRLPLLGLVLALLGIPAVQADAGGLKKQQRNLQAPPPEESIEEDVETRQEATCNKDGFSRFPYLGRENSERLLLKEGVISSLPKSLCGHNTSKNVILVVGDGMGWEMSRAGAIAKRVLDELQGLGCDTKVGCPDNLEAIEAFAGRTLDDYYTSGKGSGMSYQELENFALVTTSSVLLQQPEKGNHYAPPRSMLNGTVEDRDNGMAPLALNECGFPIDFSPLDFELYGGNMVLWNDTMGGQYPWDSRYFQLDMDTTVERSFGDGFDPTYIMQHATDSANTASALATGHKAAVNMMSVDLYEEEVSTLVEDAMHCHKAGGVVSTVPVLHATPGAFVTHSNSRKNKEQLKRGFRKINPTLAIGVCGDGLYPYVDDLQAMRNGTLSSQWTLFEQKRNVSAAVGISPWSYLLIS
jgi:alkaline phosphatase